MKKILLLILFLTPLIVSAQWYNPLSWFEEGNIFGAPSTQLRLERNINPELDSTYDLGSSTRAWRFGYFDQVCLTADSCESSWPSDAGGTGSNFTYVGSSPNDYLTASTSPIGLTITAASTILGDLTVTGNSTTTGL